MNNGCGSIGNGADKPREDAIYQVSLLQGLSCGDYCGSVSISELKRHGDTGIGTFDKLNGELIMLDGEVYRAAGNGRIERASDSETTPFAVASFMNADKTESLADIPDLESLCAVLDKTVDERGKNRFYMIRIDGRFRSIKVRSVYPQKEPYRPLAEVLESEQTVFDYEQTEGAMVGLYCPPYMSSMNAVGWHLHFISSDKSRGGHVLGAGVTEAVLTLHDANGLELRLPENEKFHCFDLAADMSKEIEKIEKSR